MARSVPCFAFVVFRWHSIMISQLLALLNIFFIYLNLYLLIQTEQDYSWASDGNFELVLFDPLHFVSIITVYFVSFISQLIYIFVSLMAVNLNFVSIIAFNLKFRYF